MYCVCMYKKAIKVLTQSTCTCTLSFVGISCVQFDDTRIVSGSWDKTIKVDTCE